MNFITYLFAFIILSCGSNLTKTKYYNISFEYKSKFTKENHIKSNSMVRVEYLDDTIIVDIIKNDSICSSETFKVKNDTIIGNWYSIEEYTYRLLFPEFNMKSDNEIRNKMTLLNSETPITEIRNEEEWTIYQEWGVGIKSNISGKIAIVNGITTLKSLHTYATPARPFYGSSTTTITEMVGFEILNFNLKWKDCI